MSFRSPHEFQHDLDNLERIEKATARYVAQAIYAVGNVAAEQFSRLVLGGQIGDRANYLGEDLTRLALDRIGAPRIPDGRLFGQTDFKLATYLFLPDFAVRQALFVDSKAEKGASNVARIQVTQTSLRIRQVVRQQTVDEAGRIPVIWETDDADYLTTTVFVKYAYRVVEPALDLRSIFVLSLPSGFLQDRYNPTAGQSIWNVGPNAPARGEAFRTRLNFTLLRGRAPWRVQEIQPSEPWEFAE